MKNTKKILTLSILAFLFIMMCAVNSTAASTKDLLKQFAENKTYLGNNGVTYHGYLIKTIYNDDPFSLRYYPPSNIPNNPISYRIDDYDEDGEPELLIVRFNSNKNAILDIYEVVNNNVTLKDSTDVKANDGSYNYNINISTELDMGRFNCFTYSLNGKKVIGVEESGCGFINADGAWIEYAVLSYNGSKLNCLGSTSFIGSDYDDDLPPELYNDFKRLGVNVNINNILSGKNIPSDYISSCEIFAGVVHETPENVREIYSDNNKYKGKIENVSNVYFIKKNVEGSFVTQNSYLPSVDGWGFENYSSSIDKATFFRVFDENCINNQWLYYKHIQILKWNDHALCEGMALSSALTYIKNPPISYWGKGNVQASEFHETDKSNYSSTLKMTLDQFVKCMWLYQYCESASKQTKNNKNKYQEIINKTVSFASTKKNPIAIIIKGREGLTLQGHVLIPYRVENSGNTTRVYVYDCNSISLGEDPNSQFIEFYKENGTFKKWKYELWAGTVWGTDYGGYISYEENFGIISSAVGTTVQSTNNLLCLSNGKSFNIVDKNGKTVTYNNGNYSGEDNSDIIPVTGNSIMPNKKGSSSEALFYADANNNYIINNKSSADVVTSFSNKKNGLSMKSGKTSTFQFNSSGESYNANIKPDSDKKAGFVLESINNSTKIEIEGTTNSSANLSFDSGKQYSFSGFNNASVELQGNDAKSISVSDKQFRIQYDNSGIKVETDTNNDGKYDSVVYDSNSNTSNNKSSTKKKKTSLGNANITGVANKTYSGRAITQNPTITIKNKVLKNGTDYSLSYYNNKNVGTAVVEAKGKGNYTGSISQSFLINPKSTKFSKVKAKKKSIQIWWVKQKKQTTGYQIQLSLNKKMKSRVLTKYLKNAKKTKTVIKQLRPKKNYYLRIRTYKKIRGCYYYSKWSKIKKVRIK